MSFTRDAAVVLDRDDLPLKKRDQRQSSPPQQCDAVTFKAPYPYKSHRESKPRQPGPFKPLPTWVPALHHPYMQIHTSSRFKPPALSTLREHHRWPEWRQPSPLPFGLDFSHHCQHHGHPSSTPAFPSGSPQQPSRFGPASLVSEGFRSVGGGYSWDILKTVSEKSLNAQRQSNGRNKGPYVRRREKQFQCFGSFEKASPHPPPPHVDLTLQHNGLRKSTNVRHPVSGYSFIRDYKSRTTCTTQDTSRSPALLSPAQASSSSSSPNHFPWLLPHFVAGSLIELRDGRLKRVEHLQTEDFLLGSLACPDLRLSCCTVQSILPSALSSSASSSRLLILLHGQQSQKLVDVYDEYPFFVRGRGWSSCSPPRTARLCGLQCRQLDLGDVCLALTPVSAPRCLPSATLEPNTSAKRPEAQPQIPPWPECPAGEHRKEAEAVRRRRYSAPELRGPGTNCM